MGPRTVTEGSSWVEPCAPHEPRTIQLSAVDNQCAQIYVAGLWFFAESDNPNMLDSHTYYKYMKQGLARCIYESPVLAGRLRTDDRGAFSVEIPVAAEQGVKFDYADLSEDPTFPSMDELRERNFPIIGANVDGLEKLIPDPMPDCGDEAQVTLAKLTKIRGGLVVFGSITHLISDLSMPRVFMNSFAQNTAKVTHAAVNNLGPLPLPKQNPDILFDRTRLIPKVIEGLSYAEIARMAKPIKEIAILDPNDPVAAAEAIQNTFPKATLLKHEEADEDNLRNYTCGIWSFTQKNYEELRAMMQKHSERKISVVDAIQSLMWQRFYAAKYALDLEGGLTPETRPASSSIVFPGDVRRRLNPPLPPNYLGAAVDIFGATMEADKLLGANRSDDELAKSLAEIAKTVRKSTDNWSQERFELMLRLTSSSPLNLPLFPAGPIDFFITDHTRTSDLLNPGWGYGLENVCHYRQPYAGREFPPGEVTLCQRQKNGNIDIMLCAEKVVLDRLLKDRLMNRYVKNLFVAYNVVEALAKERKASNNTPSPRL